MRDTYARLKNLMARRLGDRPDAGMVLTRHEEAPDVWRAPLVAELAGAAADCDLALARAARVLMALAEKAKAKAGEYTVNVRGAQRVQVDDHAGQDNAFHAPPGQAPAAVVG